MSEPLNNLVPDATAQIAASERRLDLREMDRPTLEAYCAVLQANVHFLEARLQQQCGRLVRKPMRMAGWSESKRATGGDRA